jgi:hypothetical protein
MAPDKWRTPEAAADSGSGGARVRATNRPEVAASKKMKATDSSLWSGAILPLHLNKQCQKGEKQYNIG